jgi:hypothetical protein
MPANKSPPYNLPGQASTLLNIVEKAVYKCLVMANNKT